MQKANKEFRADMKASGIRLWQIANEIGVSEATITRLLRVEVDDETKSRLAQADNALKNVTKNNKQDRPVNNLNAEVRK